MSTPVYLLSVCLVLALLTSCGNTNNRTPEETTKRFFSLMAEEDYEGAKAYASRDTDKTLDAISKLKGIFNNLEEEPGQNIITKDLDFTKDVTYTCTEEGNKASCQCCDTTTENCTTIELLNENGVWVVHQPKETNVE